MLMQIIKNNSGKRLCISNRKSKFTEGRLCCISKYLFICLIKQHLLRTHTIIIFLSGLQAIYTYFMQFVIADHLTVNNHTRTFQPGSICAIFHPAIRRNGCFPHHSNAITHRILQIRFSTEYLVCLFSGTQFHKYGAMVGSHWLINYSRRYDSKSGSVLL